MIDYKTLKYESYEKGKKEDKVKIAKKLLKMGLNIEEIEEATGLAKEEIEKLKNETKWTEAK